MCGQPGLQLGAKGDKRLKDLRSRWFHLGTLPDLRVAYVCFMRWQSEDSAQMFEGSGLQAPEVRFGQAYRGK